MAADDPKKQEPEKQAEDQQEAVEPVKTTDTPKEAPEQSAAEEPKDQEEKISSFSLLDAEKPRQGGTGNEAADAHSPRAQEKAEHQEEEPKRSEPKEKSKQISSEEVKDWLKDVRPDTTKEQEKGGGRPVIKWLAVFVILLLVAGAVAGGIYYYKQNVPVQEAEETTGPENETAQQPEDHMEEEPTATPVPEEEVDLTEYSVNVLNGSGVAGQAGAVADLLTEAGFADPDTGNADEFNYTVTEIQSKADVPESVTEELAAALRDSYSVNVLEDALDESSEYDIVVTVGEAQ